MPDRNGKKFYTSNASLSHTSKIAGHEAFQEARELAAKEGIFVGSSSGAALAAALKLIKNGAKGNIVVIFPDRGDRYFSKHLYL